MYNVIMYNVKIILENMHLRIAFFCMCVRLLSIEVDAC